jgi:putative ABC transport system permease protein
MVTDLRIALRSLGRTPRLFAFAVACLAAALGTATAVFAIVNGVVLRPLPFQFAPRLVAIWGVNPSRDTVKRGFSWPDTIDLARAVRSLDGLAAMANAPAGMTLTGRGDPAQIPMRIVSGNFFHVLGVPAALGQTLTPADDVPNSPPAVTISHALWRQRFGSDPAITGQSLTLDGRTFIVSGVAPAGFAYPPDAQMWVTIAHGAPEYVDNRSVGWLEIIGRMKPGVTPIAARADLAIPLDDLTRRYHAARGREDVSVVPLQRELLGDTRPALWALLAAVLVLLAVACANVGGLLLVRSAARAHDLAVRLALGATRRHVVGEALVESTVLLAVSSLLGMMLAAALVRAVRAAAPGNIPGIADVSVDWRVLAFAIVVTGASIAVCVIAPVLQSLSRDVLSLLQQGGRSLAGEGGHARRALAGTEIALAVLLLVTATLVTRTFLNLRAVDVGFNADRILAFDVPQPTSRYPDARASQEFADRLLPKLSALPGVQRAASVLLRPLWGVVGMDWPVTVEGQAPTEVAQNPLTNLEAVSPGYFDTMEIPILEGRDITDSDREGRAAVAVVSQSFVKRFWPDGRALGRRLKFPLPGSPYDRQWFTVVGIVGDAKYRELRGNRLDLYISSAQCPYAVHQFVVRTSGRPDSIVSAVRAEVRALDPALPIDDVVVLSDAVRSQIANPRLVALTLNGFAATASLLAALGLGTLIAWQVRLRTREIGIRLALGSTPRQVIGTVMSESIPVVAAGVGVGVTASLLLGRFLDTLLFEVAPHDPLSVVVAGGAAVAVALLSSYVAARSAARVDPLVALRND